MNNTMPVTPVVARALEEKRQQLNDDNSVARLGVELEKLGVGLALQTNAVTDALEAYGRRCERVGELNFACASTGITDYVFANHLGDRL